MDTPVAIQIEIDTQKQDTAIEGKHTFTWLIEISYLLIAIIVNILFRGCKYNIAG